MTPPPGFRAMPSIDDIMGNFAPLYRRDDEDRHVSLGFLVQQHHCNPRGDCHGGIWAALADLQLGINVGTMTGRSGPTVTLTLDYLGTAKVGQWVEGHTRLLRETPNLGFADALFTANGQLALRANGIFRLKGALNPAIANG